MYVQYPFYCAHASGMLDTMPKRNAVKEFLESSPWALAAVAFAAVASFLLSSIEAGLRIYERMQTRSEIATLEVADLRGFLLIVPSKAMADVPAVRQALGASKAWVGMFKSAANPSGRVAVWPVQLLILNPTSEPLNVHSCRMTVRLVGVKFAFSAEYFLSDTPIVESKTAGLPIRVEARDAKRVQLMFVFGGLEHMAAVKPATGAPAMQDAFTSNEVVDISCRDQARRELRTTSTMWGSVLPEADSEGRKIEYRQIRPEANSVGKGS
jgi:hypothetical protein